MSINPSVYVFARARNTAKLGRRKNCRKSWNASHRCFPSRVTVAKDRGPNAVSPSRSVHCRHECLLSDWL